MPVGDVADGCATVPSDRDRRGARVHPAYGIIGFAGRVRGSLTVIASSRLLDDMFPIPHEGRARSPPDLVDWAGEIANQALGRIKRLFCLCGVDFEAGTPTAGGLRQMTIAAPPRDATVGLTLTAGLRDGQGSAVLSVGFDVVPPPEGEIFRLQAEPIPCAAEGDLLLF